jgi:hypothetical protein
MRFSNKKEEFVNMVEGVALVISLGAVFLQIWVLISALEMYFEKEYDHLLPSVILSAAALFACGLSVYLTKIKFLKGMADGRSETYQNKTS